MNIDKDIRPTINKGNLDGYCETYWDTGQLGWIGLRINGKKYGYYEWYHRDGSVHNYYTGYYINGKKLSYDNADGSCYIWGKVEV